ncbi:MAG: FtsH protease activity modulator HflK [Deltaproteobacteria bacterium]|nr:FtsH protease activity modulator HflK [Deltaproteobacteria bacterium]
MPMDWEEWQKSRQKNQPRSRKTEGSNGQSGKSNGSDSGGPNLETIFKKLRLGGSNSHSLLIFLAIAILLWLASGFFIVETYECGLIKRFGKYSSTVEQGLRYHWPWPIESVIKVNYNQIRQFDVGGGGGGLDEATMLTGDENIVNIQFVVQYKVDDPEAYAFLVTDPDKTIRDAAISAMREVIGRNTIDGALTENRAKIQEDTKSSLQVMMDKYKTGLIVNNVELQDVHVPNDVMQAFKDVTSAREDRDRAVNEATGYKNSRLPEAEAKAYSLVAQAEAFKVERVTLAKGEAARFLALLGEYRKAPEVTRQRLLLETMDRVLKGSDKYVLSGRSGQAVLPLLGLNQELALPSQPATPAR